MFLVRSLPRWLIAVAVIFGSSAGALADTSAKTIVIFGASGNIGGLIVKEALDRGHRVVGISRSPDKLAIDDRSFKAMKGDVTNVASFRQVTAGADAVIISVSGAGAGNLPENTTHARAAATAVEALTGLADAPRVLQIGGASTMLENMDEVAKKAPRPLEQGTPFYGMIYGHFVALDTYKAGDINWTILTPPYKIRGWTPGGIVDDTRTGNYGTSTTTFVEKEPGTASIWVSDLAAAAVDEIEKPQFIRQRFTVGN